MPRSKLEKKQGCKRRDNDDNPDSKEKEKELTKQTKQDSLDEDDQGFGGWLRSPDGQENMKLFVVANSVVLLTTLMFPHIQVVVDFVYESIYGPDTDSIL